MDFFYVRTNEEGNLYIDNLYSSFNREMGEQETAAEVDALIAEFEGGEDVQKLREEFLEGVEKNGTYLLDGVDQEVLAQFYQRPQKT